MLADLARGQLRKKLPALRGALEGRFDAEHSLVVGRLLAHIDDLDEAVEDLSAAIDEQLGPLRPAVELLCTIPGVGRRAAEVILGETGGDMSPFPSAKHLASWAGMCPGHDESAGKRRSGKTRKGSKWLSQTLVECAKSANRSKNTYLAARYARLRARRGASKATIAVCRSVLTAVWHMLRTGEAYADPGGDFFARRDPERPPTARRLARTPRLHDHAARRSRAGPSMIFSTAVLAPTRISGSASVEPQDVHGGGFVVAFHADPTETALLEHPQRGGVVLGDGGIQRSLADFGEQQTDGCLAMRLPQCCCPIRYAASRLSS